MTITHDGTLRISVPDAVEFVDVLGFAQNVLRQRRRLPIVRARRT